MYRSEVSVRDPSGNKHLPGRHLRTTPQNHDQSLGLLVGSGDVWVDYRDNRLLRRMGDRKTAAVMDNYRSYL